MNKGLEYLMGRGITSETAFQLHIAYCDELNNIIGDTFPELLIREVKDLKWKGKFQDSILLPIFDLYNVPIAVTARMLQGTIKYNATIWDKSKHVYLLNLAYQTILQAGYVILVEGQFDAISLYQVGIKNVVALMGSSISQEQISLLARFTDTFTILLDNDPAGKKGALKVKESLDRIGLRNKIVTLVGSKDPDSYVKEKGINSLREFLLW